MKFESLSDKCNYYRSLADDSLLPGTYMLAMLDGRSFSKMVKKRFKLPFDDDFIRIMNKTAQTLAEKVQGVKIGFVQSDEISLLLTDFDQPGMDSFFGYRKCKLLSILASIATGVFNKERILMMKDRFDIEAYEPIQFDCKVWNVPTWNDAYAWFLYRQLDCIRNSKQQVAQQYFSHKQLEGLTTDDQIQKLKDEDQIDWWHDFDDGKKFGRFLRKEKEQFHNEEHGTDYERSIWRILPGWELSKDGLTGFTEKFPGIPHLGPMDEKEESSD